MDSSSVAPRLRTERHCGPPASIRRISALDVWKGASIFQIPPGEDLYEGLQYWARKRGLIGAAFRLLGGNVDRLSLLTGKPDKEGVATWAGPFAIPVPASVLGGHGILCDVIGQCTIHTHATFLDASGAARGCHLMRRECVAGKQGIWIAAFAYTRSAFSVRHDSETTFDVFFPERLMSEANPLVDAPCSRLLLLKLQPNEELYESLERACREAGIERALILSGVGSLNEAWLTMDPALNGDSAHGSIPGPGLEIAGVTGVICADPHDPAYQSQMTAWVTRADGTVTGGRLSRGLNAVCITFEFTLLEALPDAAAPPKPSGRQGAVHD